LACSISRASYDSASQYDQIPLCLHFAKRSESSTVLYRFNRRSADASQKSQLWPHRSHRKMEALAIENIRCTSRSDPSGSTQARSEIRFRSCIRKATFLIRDLRLVDLFSICDLRLSI